jgi:hypothetical protein
MRDQPIARAVITGQYRRTQKANANVQTETRTHCFSVLSQTLKTLNSTATEIGSRISLVRS